jgi:hypothetical protein
MPGGPHDLCFAHQIIKKLMDLDWDLALLSVYAPCARWPSLAAAACAGTHCVPTVVVCSSDPQLAENPCFTREKIKLASNSCTWFFLTCRSDVYIWELKTVRLAVVLHVECERREAVRTTLTTHAVGMKNNQIQISGVRGSVLRSGSVSVSPVNLCSLITTMPVPSCSPPTSCSAS